MFGGPGDPGRQGGAMVEKRAVLVIDVGGSHVKVLATGETERRRAPSGPDLTPVEMVAAALESAGGWHWDVVAVGVPAPVHGGRVIAEPFNLGKGWVGFDFEAAFGVPTRVINDAAMQALGSYDGGTMLFLGLGTGLGSALVVDGIVEPMEVGHLPFKKRTFEDYLGERGLTRLGRKRWQKLVGEAVAYLVEALEPDSVVLGGGNASKLGELPPNAQLGGNDNAFTGGFRLWQSDGHEPGSAE
jgi:polyphosphate glucokinase